MSQSRRSTSRSSASSSFDKNVSNSNTASTKRTSLTHKENRTPSNQKTATGYKVLGQDREMTEDELWNTSGQLSDRFTPTSSRSSFGSRPVSNTSRRTPTPSKQISLQAVKRKEEIDEPLDPIDWNDFNRAVSQNDNRIPSPVESDSDSDIPSPRQTPMSEEARFALVEQRAKDLTSALSTCRIDDQEIDLSKKLDQIDLEREKHREKEAAEMAARKVRSDEHLIQDEQDRNVFHYNHKKDSISDERKAVDPHEADEILVVKRKGENVIGKHAMDKVKDTAISSESKQKDKSIDSESDKKNEASANTEEESSSGEDSDEEDLIGEKGKAPNALLMEFVSCLMEKDFENAEKLCKMILIYEPDNPEALSFLPVIQEKRQLDTEEPEEGSDDSDDESDDSGEEEDDDSNDDSDDDDESSEDDSDDENEEQNDDDDEDNNVHPDSGIASANSD